MALKENFFPGMSKADKAKLSALGPVWNNNITAHSQIVIDTYLPLLQKSKKTAEIHKDCAYGPDPRHTLDVFCPPPKEHSTEPPRPIIVFVHGGGYTRGNKSLNGVVYDNVLHWFAQHGFVGFNIEYRLAPQAQYPAGATDLSASLQWITDNAAAYNADPNRIIIVGHSAGGTHVASYMLDPTIGIKPLAGICGFVLLSARLRADLHPENPNAKNVAAYFGEDEKLLEQNGPLSFAQLCKVPVFVGIAQFENKFLDQYGVDFALRVAQGTGKMPRLFQSQYHNHTSIVAHFGTEDNEFGREILEFIENDCFSTHISS